MAYSEFTLPDVLAKFGLSVDNSRKLFAWTTPVILDANLRLYYERYSDLAFAAHSEKARSELLVAPILAEVWRLSERRVFFASGLEFPIDAELGLTGVCEFMLGRGPTLYYVQPPYLVVVEAKRDSIPGGLGQCAATMVAARIANRRADTGIETIHGLVATGSLWQFLRLRDDTLWIDGTEYTLDRIDRVLGILLECVGVAPAPASAA